MSRSVIVVGVDGSPTAEKALLWAAAEAERRGDRLVIAYAGDLELATQPGSYQAAQSGAALLVASRRLVSEIGLGCQIDTICRDQPAVALLSELGTRAALLVVGSHGMGRDGCSSLGSVAYGVTVHALCPVAVIGAGSPGAPAAATELRGPVTVGVTANPTGVPALEFAFAEAALRRVPVVAVRSWAEFDWSEASEMAMLRRTGGNLRSHQESRLASILSPVRARYPQVPVRLRVSGDPVASSLAEASAGSAMLVLGCRYPGGRSRSRLGPTAARLIHLSRCPVVVVGNSQPATPVDGEVPMVVGAGPYQDLGSQR